MATAYDVANTFLREIGAPQTDAMRRAVAIWLRFESGGTVVGNNPWNLHSGAPCPRERGYCPGQGSLPGQIGNRYAGAGDQNVAVFRTLDDGVKANARNLTRLAPSYGYGTVLTKARSGDAVGFLTALQNSQWSASNYGYSKLVNAFRSSLGYNFTLATRMPNSAPETPNDDIPAVTRYIDEFITSRELKSTDVITDEMLNAYVDWLGKKMGQDNATFKSELRSFISGWSGKTWGSLSNTTMPRNTNRSPLDMTGDAIAFLLDGENWIYILALISGAIITAYSFAKIAGMSSSREPVPSP